MARIGRRGRLWLRGFHVFFMALYNGGVISLLVIIALTGSAESDSGLQAMYKTYDALSIVIGPAGMAGTIITGLLLSWLTPWGFFKHKWVVYTIAMAVLASLIYFTLSLPLFNKLAALVETGGLLTLQNSEYISAWNRLIIVETVKLLLVISAGFVSVIKPWERRQAVGATS